jgi:hypothetical protein
MEENTGRNPTQEERWDRVQPENSPFWPNPFGVQREREK